MLVLSRQIAETIVMTVPASAQPTTIEVRLCDVRGDRARLGVDAAREVIVDRSEVHAAKCAGVVG